MILIRLNLIGRSVRYDSVSFADILMMVLCFFFIFNTLVEK